jgi:hypothetical protein
MLTLTIQRAQYWVVGADNRLRSDPDGWVVPGSEPFGGAREFSRWTSVDHEAALMNTEEYGLVLLGHGGEDGTVYVSGLPISPELLDAWLPDLDAVIGCYPTAMAERYGYPALTDHQGELRRESVEIHDGKLVVELAPA